MKKIKILSKTVEFELLMSTKKLFCVFLKDENLTLQQS